MRIAIVNDLRMAVEVLRRIVAASPGDEIAWIAYDGQEAVDKCAEDTPDLILMDLIMPVMDGAEATRRIMEATPCVILVVTATVEGNRPKVFEAMGHGALDAVNTPVIGSDGKISNAGDLINKIKVLEKLIRKPAETVNCSTINAGSGISTRNDLPYLIVIGASTGGPHAVQELLRKLPENFPAAIIVVQHVDQEFAEGLAVWLNGGISLQAETVKERSKPEPGKVLLAATNDHLILTPKLELVYTPEPTKNPFRPSINVFFSSVAANWPATGAGILLTGIGRDGALELCELRKKGWKTFAQNERSCVVYGMPKAAVELDAAEIICTPAEIGEKLLNIIGN